tara:strand:+ start:268 stop:507 length:240 start_codon:yes stop_codon:yes gene_type:complete
MDKKRQYKKVKGSSGSSSPKNKALLQRAQRQLDLGGNLVSTPLQPRSVFDEDSPIDFSTLPTKTTFLDKIRDAARNNPE